MNNELSKKIKNELENYYHIGFNVEKVFDQNEKYKITPKDTYSNTFVINVIVRDETRLIVTCEPDQYGQDFLENINYSEEGARKNFCNYWKQLGINHLKLSINDIEMDPIDFVKDENKWKKFFIRYSKAPFYDDDNNEKEQKIIETVSWMCGMILSIASYSIFGYEEGSLTTILSKKYERNPINRKLCLAVKGYNCSVCGMNFEEKYGNIGKEFIHVHHAKPLHLMKEGYIVDPINDLFPVCPNCHNMLHRADPPYSIDELKKIISNK
jgi:5-methylcytosine-specific restriction protein A